MNSTVTFPATVRPASRRWSHAHRIVVTVIGCVVGIALMAVAQIAVGRMQTDVLSVQPSAVVGYMGSAPVVAPTDYYFPGRFRSGLTKVEPVPAQ
jgi:hypothetical protein